MDENNKKIKDAISLSQGQKNTINNRLSIIPLHIDIYKRTERMVSAVFMITTYFEKDEILRLSLRKTGSSLLKNIMSYINGRHDSYKTDLGKRIVTDISELYSYFEFAYLGQMISENNYQILIQELDKSADLIKDLLEETKIIQGQELNENFFDIKGHSKGQEEVAHRNVKDTRRLNLPKINFKGHKDDLMKFLNTQKDYEILGEDNHSKKVKTKNSNREEKIIEIIKDKKEVSIKDITDIFSGVSSKTIQRELSKLVDNGTLIKKGDRRWSKYKLG